MGIKRHLPSIITGCRLLLGPAFISAYRHQIGGWVLMIIVVAAIFSDWFDGFLARRWQVVSTFGKLVDPLADVFFCMAVFFLCWQEELIPGWLLTLFLGREVLITIIFRPLALFFKIVISAIIWGKVKTSFQFGVIVTFVILRMDIIFPEAFLTFLITLGAYIAISLSFIAAGIHICRFFKALRRHKACAPRDASGAG